MVAKRGRESKDIKMIPTRLNHRILSKKYQFPFISIDRNSSSDLLFQALSESVFKHQLSRGIQVPYRA